MLSRRMELNLNGTKIGDTPMLVPSFSSRLNIDICETIEIMSKYISTPILISAYDLYYSDDFPTIDFPDIIFIDSGGYECAIDTNISEIGYYNPESFNWDKNTYLETLNGLPDDIPTVIISYDSPKIREPIENQIKNAEDLFDGKNNVLKEILIKAEEEGSVINPDSVIENIDTISSFDIIGFTEKELGDSLFNRMTNIARIRQEMDRNDIQIPIHIFGSLDTLTTPLYYFSGADIFDGLSWLRLTYHEGDTFILNV